MYTKLYWLHQFSTNAKLAIMARPRGGEWLEDEIIQFMKQQVRIIVSLLESDEIYELGLREEEKLCTKHGLSGKTFPESINRALRHIHGITQVLFTHIYHKCGIARACL